MRVDTRFGSFKVVEHKDDKALFFVKVSNEKILTKLREYIPALGETKQVGGYGKCGAAVPKGVFAEQFSALVLSIDYGSTGQAQREYYAANAPAPTFADEDTSESDYDDADESEEEEEEESYEDTEDEDEGAESDDAASKDVSDDD